MNDIRKIVLALGDSNILLKGVTETINNERKSKIFKHVAKHPRG